METGAFISKIKFRNFKSFRKVDVDLIKGFQALIGPNGSGKSNVCDGIRFAIGETKLSNLRASKINDLISHGADSAEVTIVVETGREQHSISRKVNKEGKSDYILNGKKTTRTNITQFLKQYKIENESHNVIGQGEVTRLTVLTATEKRKIIDEIAGVAEFDSKKNEALKELETVQTRINDAGIILKEKEGAIRELEKEKEFALKYIDLKKRISNIRNTIINAEIENYEKEYDTLLHENAQNRIKENEIDKNIEEIESKVEIHKEELKKITDEINSKTVDNKTYLEHEALVRESSVLKSKKEMWEEDKISKENTLIEQELKLREIDNKISGNSIISAEEERELNTWKKKYEEAKSKFELVRKRNTTLVNDSIKYGEEIKSIEQDLEIRDKICNDLILSVSEKELKMKNNKEIIEEIEKEHKELTGEQRDIEKEIRELQKEFDKIKKENESLFNKERSLNLKLAETDKELIKTKSELSNYQGVSKLQYSEIVLNFIKEMQNKNVVKGVHGAVHELCNFDEKYSAAIESAVGGRLNYIIADNVDCIKEVVDLLRKNKTGRATFVPLTMKPVSSDVTNYLNYPGVVGRLIDFVNFDEKYFSPMSFIFGDTLVVNDIEIAKDIGLIGKARIVTIHGDVIEKSSVIQGGYFTTKMNLASRKKAVDLENKLNSLMKDKEEITNELVYVREKSSQMRRERGELEAQMKSLEIDSNYELKEHEVREKNLQKVKTLKDENKKFEREIKEEKEQNEKTHSNLIKQREKLTQLRQKKSEIDNALYSKVEGSEEEINKILEKISNIETTIKSKNNEISLLYNSKEEIIDKIEKIKNEIDKNTNSIEETNKRLNEIEISLVHKKIEMEKSSNKIKKLMNERDSIQNKLDEQSSKKGEQLTIKQKIAQELAKYEIKIQNVKERLIDFKAQMTNEPYEKVEGSTNKLKSELSEKELQIGPMHDKVNLIAPKVYEHKKNEIEGVADKLKQLEKERESVIYMINEVEKRKFEVFMETFDTINSNFKNLFTQTFEKDYADLILLKPEDPFTGGLDVKITRTVKNSKKPVIERLESLSGGEKSVVALLLVFAIHMHKPSAFYILDEVESALDVINVRLVANLIKKLSTNTQFIVASHNDTTISESEAILGVSRGQEGSKIVSLALDQVVLEKGENQNEQ